MPRGNLRDNWFLAGTSLLVCCFFCHPRGRPLPTLLLRSGLGSSAVASRADRVRAQTTTGPSLSVVRAFLVHDCTVSGGQEPAISQIRCPRVFQTSSNIISIHDPQEMNGEAARRGLSPSSPGWHRTTGDGLSASLSRHIPGFTLGLQSTAITAWIRIWSSTSLVLLIGELHFRRKSKLLSCIRLETPLWSACRGPNVSTLTPSNHFPCLSPLHVLILHLADQLFDRFHASLNA